MVAERYTDAGIAEDASLAANRTGVKLSRPESGRPRRALLRPAVSPRCGQAKCIRKSLPISTLLGDRAWRWQAFLGNHAVSYDCTHTPDLGEVS